MNEAPSRVTNSWPGPAWVTLKTMAPPTPRTSATAVAITAVRTLLDWGIDIVVSFARLRTPHCTEPTGHRGVTRAASFSRVLPTPSGAFESVRVSGDRLRPVRPR